ncbi:MULTISPECIES: hypothetical protein [unclassified Streptomyces]|uniref:hypothetical protein n=1 Tax=unclassified Streptomyces TaxID=2593676 RepID=UPI002DDA88ED|nr:MULTISPECIES: hypothetical protein [unclassified Streptomyces]WSA93840.1 hypothetical protein OIE63_21350 [Streptomyces sp. NBC_01795]WSB78211.1 hypothetical protein OHB04_22190 [Streptomyces sp. NBC_01775]WSS13534.1 hypothetical protein OG533_17770 [Streptomyces sp. NBC_01186]WSS42332.1 hypothetical protein OG220_18385 [Streptomyces sp. NBC_01187]
MSAVKSQNRWAVRAAARATVLAAATGALTLVPVTAHADESPRHAHNGPRVGLVNTGQIDDPAEDVLEHTLLLGDDYRWI